MYLCLHLSAYRNAVSEVIFLEVLTCFLMGYKPKFSSTFSTDI